MKILHRYFIQHWVVFLTMISKKNVGKKIADDTKIDLTIDNDKEKVSSVK